MTALPRRGSVPRVGRLDVAALQGVLIREVVNFSSYWRGTTFSSTVQPIVYLLAFGLGFGALVPEIAGYSYVEFVGTGTVATAVLFSSAFPAMFGTFVKATLQHTYDAVLAAPVDTEEIVTAEAVWMAVRAGTYGCIPLIVTLFFGLEPRLSMLAVPFIGVISGYGWSCFGILIAGFSKSFENFSYIVSGVLTPIMLTAGTFFPIEGLPEWAQVLAQFNPLYHCVELVRAASFGWDFWPDLWSLVFMLLFGLVTWRIAIAAMTRKLIT